MATGNTTNDGTKSIDITTSSDNLSKFVPCSHTFVATRSKHNRTHNDGYSDNNPRAVVPRVCRLRTCDNAIAIYALVDPIGPSMIAADLCMNMFVEQINEISVDDDSYKMKVNDSIQQLFYGVENRLLQLIFDHAEQKMVTSSTHKSADDKLLQSIDEAQSGAFMFTATIIQSTAYIAYVG